MLNRKGLLIAAAVAGAFAAVPTASQAMPTSGPTAEKHGCSGRDGCGGFGAGRFSLDAILGKRLAKNLRI
jgi:hypothetical protein